MLCGDGHTHPFKIVVFTNGDDPTVIVSLVIPGPLYMLVLFLSIAQSPSSK